MRSICISRNWVQESAVTDVVDDYIPTTRTDMEIHLNEGKRDLGVNEIPHLGNPHLGNLENPAQS